MSNTTTNNEQQVFNTCCIYGVSGTSKTTQIAALAMYVAERYGKRTRLISADGGGWGPIQPYIDAGIIEALNLTNEKQPIPRLTQLARGAWPDASGKYVEREKQKDFDSVGMYAIEGFESLCEHLKAHLVEEKKKVGQDLAVAFTEIVPETGEKLTYGNIGLAHYGWLQNNLVSLIRGFQGLLNYGVKQVVFTSLCAVGEDDVRSVKVLGPSSAGKALTANLPQRLGDLIYLEVVQVPSEGKNPARNEYRAYITNRVDKVVQRAWPAKFRLPLPLVHKLKQKDSGIDVQWDGSEGYIVLDEEAGRLDVQGLGRLWRWRDQQAAGAVEGLVELRKKYFGQAVEEVPTPTTPEDAPTAELPVAPEINPTSKATESGRHTQMLRGALGGKR